MKKYRVYLECSEVDRKYIDVDASSEAEANDLAQEMHCEDGNVGVWMPQFYTCDHFVHGTEELS